MDGRIENKEIVITGTVFQELIDLKTDRQNISGYRSQDVLNVILKDCRVYARMSPTQKAMLIKLLQDRSGEMIGMCGDGANDCNALKVADVGLSLSSSEASIAAPFTSTVEDISSLVNLLRIGRSSLDLSYLLFKYMLVYSSMEFTSVIILYFHTSNISDTQLMFIDMFCAVPMTIFLSSLNEKKRLEPRFPPSSLLSPSILLSLIGQMILMGLSILGIYFTLRRQGFFEMNEKSGDIEDENHEVTTIFWFTLPLYIYLGFVFKSSSKFMSSIGDLPQETLILAAFVFFTQIGLWYWIILGPLPFMKNSLDLVTLDFYFRIIIAGSTIGITLISFIYECWISWLVRKGYIQ